MGAVLGALLNPAILISLVLKLVAGMVWMIGYVITKADPTVGGLVQNWGTKFSGVEFQSLWGVGVYLMSPWVVGSVFTGCVAAWFDLWLFSVLVRLGIAAVRFFLPYAQVVVSAVGGALSGGSSLLGFGNNMLNGSQAAEAAESVVGE